MAWYKCRYGRVDCRTDTVGLQLRYKCCPTPATLLLTRLLLSVGGGGHYWVVGGGREEVTLFSNQFTTTTTTNMDSLTITTEADFCQAPDKPNSAVTAAHLPATTLTIRYKPLALSRLSLSLPDKCPMQFIDNVRTGRRKNWFYSGCLSCVIQYDKIHNTLCSIDS